MAIRISSIFHTLPKNLQEDLEHFHATRRGSNYIQALAMYDAVCASKEDKEQQQAWILDQQRKTNIELRHTLREYGRSGDTL